MFEYPAKYRVGSIDFTPATLEQAIKLIESKIGNSQPIGTMRGTSVHFANAYNIALAENDGSYQELMSNGDFVFTDGVPVVWAARRLHPERNWERVYGPDVTGLVLKKSECGKEFKHYFIGGTEQTMSALLEQVNNRFPEAEVVGYECPPFREPTAEELEKRDQRIADSGATVVWVGLGTPKQDFEVQRLANRLPIVALAVGAAFDFIAQTVPQAPRWMQRSGLEWAFRLLKEPRRLAKRYLWGNPQFVKSVIYNRS